MADITVLRDPNHGFAILVQTQVIPSGWTGSAFKNQIAKQRRKLPAGMVENARGEFQPSDALPWLFLRFKTFCARSAAYSPVINPVKTSMM